MKFAKGPIAVIAILSATLACNNPATDNSNTQGSGGSEQKKAASFQPYKDPKQRFEVQDVAVSSDHIDAEDTIKKLPARFKPSGPARSKTVVLELMLASEKDDMSEIKSSEFSLVYQADGKSNEAPCAGLSMGDSTMWGLAEKGETSMFVRAKPTQKQKLLFLLPGDVGEASLQHNQPGGESVIIKQAITLGKS
ncbi:MAG: hypothetical protein L0229_30445 [Blastocatellia bacterium]|nr:hypothetical protein [Blastocatellia bacterium]